MNGVENGVELGVFGSSRRAKDRVPEPVAGLFFARPISCSSINSTFLFLMGKGDNSSSMVSLQLKFKSCFVQGLSRSSTDVILRDGLFWRCLGWGRLLGAGGGEGNGRHKGVMGELITTSACFKFPSFSDFCTDRYDGGLG